MWTSTVLFPKIFHPLEGTCSQDNLHTIAQHGLNYVGSAILDQKVEQSRMQKARALETILVRAL